MSEQREMDYRHEEPIRVKCYGLLPLTKKTYVAVQSIVLVLCALMLGGIWVFRTVLPWSTLLFWLTAGALVAEIIEAGVILWRFSVLEKKARERG